MQFEWDPDKNLANQAKHGVSFEEATELFSDASDYLEIYDATHSLDEDRLLRLGRPVQVFWWSFTPSARRTSYGS